MAFPAFAELGVCEYVWRWLPDDFAEAWTQLTAPEVAQALVRLGFDFDEVVAPAGLVDQAGRLGWRTPEAAHNAVLRLCELVPEAEPELCAMYLAAYPVGSVAGKFLEYLERGPAAPVGRVEPVYLGRPTDAN